MFENCVSLKHVNLDGFKLNVSIESEYFEYPKYDYVEMDMTDMFKGCLLIEKFDLSKINVVLYGGNELNESCEEDTNNDETKYYDDEIAHVGNAFVTGNPNLVIIPHPRIKMTQ